MNIAEKGIKPVNQVIYFNFKYQGLTPIEVGNLFILQGYFIFLLLIAKKLPNKTKGVEIQIHKITNNAISDILKPTDEDSKENNILTIINIINEIPGNKNDVTKEFFNHNFPSLFL